MQLNLKNPVVFFDLETTGINITHDRIVEISFVKVHPGGKEEIKSRRINPEMPIPPQATAIHGITDDDVKDCPTFRQVARSLADQLEGCDLAGFNSSVATCPSAEFSGRCDFHEQRNLWCTINFQERKVHSKRLPSTDKHWKMPSRTDAIAIQVLKSQYERYPICK